MAQTLAAPAPAHGGAPAFALVSDDVKTYLMNDMRLYRYGTRHVCEAKGCGHIYI